MKMIKFFDENGNVDFREANSSNTNDVKVIRVIPDNHKHFNNGEYVEINNDNKDYLSEGDMIITITSTGTDWHTIVNSEHHNCLVYKEDRNIRYDIEYLISNPRFKKIMVRNDFFVSSYAQGDKYISSGEKLKNQIARLSSGTVSSISGFNKYDDIYKIVEALSSYSERLPESFKWQSAWDLFSKSKMYKGVIGEINNGEV